MMEEFEVLVMLTLLFICFIFFWFDSSNTQVISNVTLGRGATILQESIGTTGSLVIKNVTVEGDIEIIQTSRGTLIRNRK